MKVKNIGSNMTQVEGKDVTVLISYETPVAALTQDGFIRTSKKWSVTTSKHINKWLAGAKAVEVDQSVLDNLL